MLKMIDVSKIYRTELIETHALRNVNLEIKEGEFVSVSGPDSSGQRAAGRLRFRRELRCGAWHLGGRARHDEWNGRRCPSRGDPERPPRSRSKRSGGDLRGLEPRNGGDR